MAFNISSNKIVKSNLIIDKLVMAVYVWGDKTERYKVLEMNRQLRHITFLRWENAVRPVIQTDIMHKHIS